VEKPEKMVLSREERYQLQRRLAIMSITGLQDFYRAACYRCRLENAGLPPARSMQELIQAWKNLNDSAC
jgi:hypothetical protein